MDMKHLYEMTIDEMLVRAELTRDLWSELQYDAELWHPVALLRERWRKDECIVVFELPLLSIPAYACFSDRRDDRDGCTLHVSVCTKRCLDSLLRLYKSPSNSNPLHNGYKLLIRDDFDRFCEAVSHWNESDEYKSLCKTFGHRTIRLQTRVAEIVDQLRSGLKEIRLSSL
jgi:hypothetical protein